MSPARRLVGLVLTGLVVGLLIGTAIGATFHSASPSAPGASTLTISAAGTLGSVFPGLARVLANSTPGVSAPFAAQTYQGSIAAVEAATRPGESFDVVASADYRLIPQLLEPASASWQVFFATTPVVLAYDPSVPAFDGINASNWAVRLTEPGVLLGVANASVDPAGYNAIFALELQGVLDRGDPGALYSHFYSGAPGGYAVPNPATTRVEPESQAASLLAAHAVSAFLIYGSYALENGLAFVSLDPRVNLGGTSGALIAAYSEASTTISAPGGSGPEVVHGAPVVFAATVPNSARDPALGNLFIHLLASVQGGALLAAAGFTAIVPAWSDYPARVPAPAGFDVVGAHAGGPAPPP